MKFNLKRFLPIAIIGVCVTLIGVCCGSWFFSNGKKAETSFGAAGGAGDEDTNVHIDDINENYYFASDLNPENYYNVYFFPSPDAAKYADNGTNGTKVETYKVTANRTETCTRKNWRSDWGSWEIGEWSSWGVGTLTNTQTTSSFKNPKDYYDAGGASSSSSVASETTDNNDATSWTGDEPWFGNTWTRTQTKTGYYTVTSTSTTSYPSSGSQGYWGSTQTPASSDKDTNDGTVYGYKKFTDVYKQLSTTQYLTLGDLFCTFGDGYGWYGYFAGFTSDESVAQNNLKSGNSTTAYSVPQVDLFDLNNPLSVYDTDNDHNIYLYAIYTNGKDPVIANDSSKAKFPGVHIIQDGQANNPEVFQWMFLPSTSSSWTFGTNSVPYTYSIKNVLVKSNSSSNPLLNVYYKDKNYLLQTDHLHSDGGYDGGWNGWQNNSGQRGDFNINLSNLLNDKLVNDCVYNFYVYYNETSVDNASLSSLKNSTIDTNMNKKNIIFQTDTSSDDNGGNLISKSDHTNYDFYLTDDLKVDHDSNTSSYMKIYIEKVYNYQVTGDLTGSYVYNDPNASATFPISYSKTDDDGYYVYESNEMIFPNPNKTSFTINYGSKYDSSILSLDDAITPCYQSNGTQYTNPSGKKVYYLGTTTEASSDTDAKDKEYAHLEKTANVESSGIPILDFNNNAGSYKIMVRVKYSTTGVPSEIKVSAAYLKGFFVEIFDDNPTTKLVVGSTTTDYVDHSNYKYKANLASTDGVTSINASSEFNAKSGSGTSSFTEIVPTDKVLYDHVLGKKMMIDPNCKITGHDSTNIFYYSNEWHATFPVMKNYIFYLHDIP